MDWSALGTLLNTVINTMSDTNLTFVSQTESWADDETSESERTVKCILEYVYEEATTVTSRNVKAIIGLISGYTPMERDQVKINDQLWKIDGITPIVATGAAIGYELRLKR